MKSSPWFRWLGAGFRYRRQVSMKSSPYLPILFGTFLTIFVAVPKAEDNYGEQIKQNFSLYLNDARWDENRGEQIKKKLSLYLNVTINDRTC